MSAFVHICWMWYQWVYCAHLFVTVSVLCTFPFYWCFVHIYLHLPSGERIAHTDLLCVYCARSSLLTRRVYHKLCKCLLLLASLLWVHIMCRTFVCCGCIVCMSYERIWHICLHVFNLKVKSVFAYLLVVGVLCTFVCICSKWRVYLNICLFWAYCAHLFAFWIRAHHVTVHMWVVSVSCTCVVRVLCTCLHLLWVHIIVWGGYD